MHHSSGVVASEEGVIVWHWAIFSSTVSYHTHWKNRTVYLGSNVIKCSRSHYSWFGKCTGQASGGQNVRSADRLFLKPRRSRFGSGGPMLPYDHVHTAYDLPETAVAQCWYCLHDQVMENLSKVTKTLMIYYSFKNS